ncbi:MAG: sensor histidine kinase [Myxococcota bacterium]
MSDLNMIDRNSVTKRSPHGESDEASWFDSFFDGLFAPSFRAADVSDRNRARFMVVTLLLSASIAVSVLLGRWNQGVPAVMVYAGSIFVAATGLLFAFRAGAPLGIISNGAIGLVYFWSVGLVIASGGESAPAVMMSSLVPLVAYGVRGRRAAIHWTGAVLVGIAVTALYAQTTDTYLYRGDMLAWTTWRFPSMALMVGFMLLAALGVEWNFERSVEETDALQKQIRIQAERYRDLVENVGDCMMEYDARHRCIYASPNWEELMGRAPGTLLGRGYLDCLHADDFEGINEQSEALLLEPGRTVKYRSRVQHVRGHWIEGEVSARSFYTSEGEIHIVTIFRDLRELYQAQLALRHKDRLATAGTLAAGVAHQINNPIGGIRMASELALLTADEGDTELVKKVLKTNIEQAARCGEIVRSLLQFAAREHRDKKNQDLRGVIERSCEFARGFGGEHGVYVEIIGGEFPLPVEISEVEIEQVIVNLLRNAIESRPRSKRVEIKARCEDGKAVVEVRDDGCGMPEENLEQVFDPFFTTRLAEGGNGLGLSVALGIAREHGGTLEVESEEGVGSCVRLRLPIVAAA